MLGAARPIETGLISRGCQWGEVIEDKRQADQQERERKRKSEKKESNDRGLPPGQARGR